MRNIFIYLIVWFFIGICGCSKNNSDKERVSEIGSKNFNAYRFPFPYPEKENDIKTIQKVGVLIKESNKNNVIIYFVCDEGKFEVKENDNSLKILNEYYNYPVKIEFVIDFENNTIEILDFYPLPEPPKIKEPTTDFIC